MFRIKLAPLSRHLRITFKLRVRAGRRRKPGSGVGHGMSVKKSK